MRTLARILALVLIFMIPWEGMIRFPGVGTATKLIGFVVAGFWLATVIITGQLRKPRPFHLAVYIFVLWNAASVFWSADPGRTFNFVLTWVQLGLLVFILWDLFTTRTILYAGLQSYIFGEYLAVGSAIANFFSGNAFYTNYERFSSGDTNPDGFAFILVLGIPVAWYLATSKQSFHFSNILKWINIAYIPAALVGIALSGTRTALIASIPAMAYGISTLNRLSLRIKTLILIFFVLAAVLLLPDLNSLRSFQRFRTTTSEITTGDLNERTLIWRDGLATFVQHPLLGIGSNMYRSINTLGKVAHNSYLSILIEVGLIGLSLFAIILAMALTMAWAQPKWDSSFWLALLLVWSIGCFTLSWEYRKTTWLFLGLLVASAAINETNHQVKDHLANKPVQNVLNPAQRLELPKVRMDQHR